MMLTDQLAVSVDSLPVATLRRSGEDDRGSALRYHSHVPVEQGVSLLMPPKADDYAWARGVHPIFEMNLPEGHLRYELMRMFSKAVRGFDDFELLRVVGPHQLGRVVVGDAAPIAVPGTSISDLLVYDGSEQLFDDLMQQYARYSGVSGIQPKVLVRSDTDEPERVTHRGATHIVKSWREDEYPQLAANEFFCMKAAEYSGLPVAKVALSSHGRLLIVDRFDLEGDKYLGFEDLCVLNGWSARDKYDGSYEGCARQIKQLVSPLRVKASLRELFVSVALTAAVRNGDAHLKNFGLLYRDTGAEADVWLAPTYDIVTTTAYRQDDSMALIMEGSKAWPKHKRLQAFGVRSCEMTARHVNQAMEQIADAISRAGAELSAYMHDHPEFQQIGSRMLASWDAGVARSLLEEGRAINVDMGRR